MALFIRCYGPNDASTILYFFLSFYFFSTNVLVSFKKAANLCEYLFHEIFFKRYLPPRVTFDLTSQLMLS